MKKGFTLLELLIVIGILAILATATVLVLNPAELLRQARDSQRVSDLASLNSAISLYVTAANTPLMASSSNAATNSTCHSGGGTYTCYSDRNALLGVSCGGRYASTAVATSTSRKIDRGGWLPIDFTSLPGGSPLPNLPTDPSNTASLYYGYACQNDLTFVLTAAFESTKYGTTLPNPASTDGGGTSTIYEIGTTPGLNGPNSGGM